MITSGAVWEGRTGPMPKTMFDGTKLFKHQAISMLEYLKWKVDGDCDLSFKKEVSDMFVTFRDYMSGIGKVDACMFNLNCRTAIIDLQKLLFEGELYGASASDVPIDKLRIASNV